MTDGKNARHPSGFRTLSAAFADLWSDSSRTAGERQVAAPIMKTGDEIVTPMHEAGLSPESSARLVLHLISDATGESLNVLTRAALAQFPGVRSDERLHALVRTRRQLDRAIKAIETKPGLVMSTITDPELTHILNQACRRLNVPHVSPLDPVIGAFRSYLGRDSQARPGAQHELDAAYFDRIEALNFTMAHDDGALADDLDHADVVLVGVSRTSKTPTSIYLANRGVKVANIPLVPESPPPSALFETKGPLIVGLTASSGRIVDIRRNRLRSLNQGEDYDYADDEAVKSEVLAAKRLFAKHGWPVIDVTRRSIEETAAAILNLLAARRTEP